MHRRCCKDWILKKIPANFSDPRLVVTEQNIIELGLFDEVINMFNIVELALVLQPFYFSTSGGAYRNLQLHGNKLGFSAQVPDGSATTSRQAKNK